MPRIALAQINTTVGDLRGNRRKILEAVSRAQQHRCDVLVCPELTITGYPPEDLLLKEHFIEDNLKILHSLRACARDLIVIVGFVDRDHQRRLYNAAAVLFQNKIKAIYHKQCLPNYGVFDERRYFTAGQAARVLQVKGIRFAVNICEDIWSQDATGARPERSKAHIVFNLSASPYHRGKKREREEVVMHYAQREKAFVCYCNLVGGQDELVFDGGSLVVSPEGKIVAQGRSCQEDLLIVDINCCKLSPSQRRPGTAVDFCSKRASLDLARSEVQDVYDALVLGTRDYMRKNKFQKAVLGLSGGIDSALVAAIACDAIGAQHVVGVSMPSLFTSPETKADARRVAKNLGVAFHEIPITALYRQFVKTLRGVFQGAKQDQTEENMQARIRGMILMALSNKFGYLVLTTGNKSELAVGYCTLYGDMAGGFAVIKDVPKTFVYRLVEFVNQRAAKALIPSSVIERAPTAELRKNQRDEDSLPPYHILDPILASYIEHDQGLRVLQKMKSGQRLARRVVHLVDAMEYKRRQAPIGVKITPKAFGRDRRLPLTNYYQEKYNR